MQVLNETEILLLRLVAKQYYLVIPEKFKTYCVFNSRVLAKVFEHFGIESEVVPCQALLSQPAKSSVIGFVGSSPGEGGWDGHVICRVGDHYIDATVRHFSESIGDNLPDTVVFQRLPIQSNVLGRSSIDDFNRFWWVTPPAAFDPTPPEEDKDAVLLYAKKLVEHIEQMLAPSSRSLPTMLKTLAAAATQLFQPAHTLPVHGFSVKST